MSETVLNTHTKLYVIEPTVLGHPSSPAKEESGQVYLLVRQGLDACIRLILHFQQ